MAEQLRYKLRSLKTATKVDIRYSIEAYEDDLVELIDQHTKEQITNVLDRLEKKSVHYTEDGLVADGLDPWAVSVNRIAEERKKLL